MSPRKDPHHHLISEFVRVAVLAWSAALLTAGYFGHVKADPTFIPSVFSGSLAWYGIQKQKDNEKPPERIQNRTVRKPPNPLTKPKP